MAELVSSQDLFSKYPLLFYYGQPRCGVQIYSGWLPVVDQLCADITKEMEKLPRKAYFQVDQIKEKFGGLRFYYSGPNFDNYLAEGFGVIGIWIWYMLAWVLRWNKKIERARRNIDELVKTAERQCWKVCEDCGKPGSRGGIGWIKTLCDDCQESLVRYTIKNGGIDRARNAIITEIGLDKWFAIPREERNRLVREMNAYLLDKANNQKPHF